MIEHRTQLQAQAAMGGQEGIARDLRPHLTIAQDEMRQHGEHRMTRRALEAPDGHPTQAHAEIMRVARQASTTTTHRLVLELKAARQDEGEHEFDKRLAIVQELKVGRFMLKINSDGAVFSGLAGPIVHGSSSGPMVGAADDPPWANTSTISRCREGQRSLTTKFRGMCLMPCCPRP